MEIMEIREDLYKKVENRLKINRRQFEILAFLLITSSAAITFSCLYKDPIVLFSLPILVIINMIFSASLVISQKTITSISQKVVDKEFADYLKEEIEKLPYLIIDQQKVLEQSEKKLKELLAIKELNNNL